MDPEKKEEEQTPQNEGEGTDPKKENEGAEEKPEGEEPKGEETDKSGSEKKEEKPQEGEGQPTEDKDTDKVVDELLSDGTPASKKINVQYDKYQDVNDKAKLYEQFAPTLAKLEEKQKEDPNYLDKLLETGEKGDLKTRLERLEEDLNSQKRADIKKNVSEAYELWGKKFTDNWKEIRPMVDQLQKQGFAYREALQRATYAVVPELISENKSLIRRERASQYQNEQGKMSGGGGQGYSATQEASDYAMSDEDKLTASRLGVDPKLYKKHANFLKEKGFDQL